MKLLEGKTAIITGASRGIGRGIAEVFAKNGANVAFTYSSSAAAAQELENELTALGVKAKGYQSNAADFNEAQKLVDDVIAAFGNVDILINNAGITKDNLLMRISEEDFDTVIDVNLKSVFNMTKAVQKIMLKNRAGSIINMSSVVGVKGNAGQTNYAASKAGVIGFSKSVALELGSRNIRCNVIAPGFIETEMTAKLNE
ncbi:MAG: SDR family NAD(P)-dependent oxidoreductase, partial [Flavobacterium sp.]|nr:SDR family NAD(P)-dependent oxidoreductase [Flavobacterium sp.]